MLRTPSPLLVAALAWAAWSPRTAPAATLLVPEQFPTIQSAIDAAEDRDEILVGPGVYHEAIDFLGKRFTLRSTDGAAATVIDALRLGVPVVTIIGSPAGTELHGFTLTHGNGRPDDVTGATRQGGGLFILSAEPFIVDCVIDDNNAFGVTFTSGWGGGAYVEDGAAAFLRCRFIQNKAGQRGGAMFATPDAEIILSHSELLGNDCPRGAAVYLVGTTATVDNCLFSGNGGAAATISGGAFFIEAMATLNVTSSTMAFNGGHSLGETLSSTSSMVRFVNSILWGDSPNAVNQIDSLLTYQYCNIIGAGGSGPNWNASLGLDGGGNIDADPRFRDHDGADDIRGTADDDFTLTDESPSIDAGVDWPAPLDVFDLDGDSIIDELIPIDLAGEPRRQNNPNVLDTGDGPPPIIDMGAFESHSVNTTADLSGDGVVNGHEVAFVLSAWGPCPGQGVECPADLNADGAVDQTDLAIILDAWTLPAP